MPFLAVPGIGQRLVVHALGTEVRRAGPVGARLQRAVSRRAVRHVAISQYTADVLRRSMGINATVIPPALERPGAPVDRDPATSPVTVLSVGRLVERKGHLDLVAAIEEVRHRGVAVTLVIAGGSGPAAVSLRALARAKADWFTLVEDPTDDEVVRLYRHADVFALLSKDVGAEFEGFGIVFLEAASWGLPVVAGRSGGTADAVRDGETGIIASSPAECAAALEALAIDGARRIRLGVAGRAFADQHSLATIASSFERLHADLGHWGAA